MVSRKGIDPQPRLVRVLTPPNRPRKLTYELTVHPRKTGVFNTIGDLHSEQVPAATISTTRYVDAPAPPKDPLIWHEENHEGEQAQNSQNDQPPLPLRRHCLP